ncbi:MAG: adenylyltransferase/cytidyltransferase family protein [Motiliproteus sp.]
MSRVITFGTFDLFHVGHLQIIKRAKALGNHITVGISTDELNFSKKQKSPVCCQHSRMEIVKELKCVDSVFFEHSLELKRQYILEHKADILVMGDDWDGKFDDFNDICQVRYLPRTPSISTTELVEIIRTK